MEMGQNQPTQDLLGRWLSASRRVFWLLAKVRAEETAKAADGDTAVAHAKDRVGRAFL